MGAAAVPIAMQVGGSILGGLVTQKLFGGKEATTPAPPPTPAAPAPMPLPDDAAVQQARKRAAAKRMADSGRLSTILSDNYAGSASGDKLGG